MNPARIFVALRPEPLQMALTALQGYDLAIAQDLDHAHRLIEVDGDVDLFLIGILFDDSKAMELINTIRLDTNKKDVPILVTRLMPSQYEGMLSHVMDTMKALGTISCYFEADYQQTSVQKQLRELVEAYLPVHKIVATGPKRGR